MMVYSRNGCNWILLIVITVVILIFTVYSRVEIQKKGAAINKYNSSSTNSNKPKNLAYEITDCFTSKSDLKSIYRCGRNHHLVPFFKEDKFFQFIGPFLQIFSKRLHNFTTDGSINNRFALWSFLRIMQPEHVIESGANKGYGTWLIRKALPKARITVISPTTPNQYLDKRNSTKYFTSKKFLDFNRIDWSKEKIKREKTIVYFDDHQSVYKRIVQAAKHGFKHIIFDDNYLAGSTSGLSNNLSVRQACDAAGCLVKVSSQFYTKRYIDNFGAYNKSFELNSKFRQKVGSNLDKLLSVIYEPPYLCDILLYPFDAQKKSTYKLFRSTVTPLLTKKHCKSIQINMKLPLRGFRSYANTVYVQLK
ncbi:unnamed protein product [Dimorphilus gyrociliatus]|uniref:Uncharacterized protein n=1 Tax=Dimorphilus gyrociliatus TaxID=2664684 RepID=A0A7I8WFN3_9ANNE|nr:unnamed protein product [Dimorphilus gyrociliatus]